MVVKLSLPAFLVNKLKLPVSGANKVFDLDSRNEVIMWINGIANQSARFSPVLTTAFMLSSLTGEMPTIS